MSLVPFAIRVCTVRALQAALPPSVKVIDSPQEPLDQLDSKNPQPIVAVYTGYSETKLHGRNLLGGEPTVSLAIQIFLPERFTFTYKGENGDRTIEIDCRRQGAETALDVLWRMMALNLNSGSEPWGELWREFVVTTPSVSAASFLLERANVRVTAREIVLQCDPIHEPVPGEEPYLAWAALGKALVDDKGSDGLHHLADFVRSQVISAYGDKDMQDAAYLGLSGYVYDVTQGDVEPRELVFPNDPVRPLFDAIPIPDGTPTPTDEYLEKGKG